MQALLRSVVAGTGSEAGLGGLDVASTRRLVAVRLEEARTPGEVALVAGVAWGRALPDQRCCRARQPRAPVCASVESTLFVLLGVWVLAPSLRLACLPFEVCHHFRAMTFRIKSGGAAAQEKGIGRRSCPQWHGSAKLLPRPHTLTSLIRNLLAVAHPWCRSYSADSELVLVTQPCCAGPALLDHLVLARMLLLHVVHLLVGFGPEIIP